MDPFIMQLVIVPVVVIGLGILTAFLTKRIILAPIVTLLLNVLYEILWFNFYYPNLEFILTSWNIIFPMNALLLALIFVKTRRHLT